MNSDDQQLALDGLDSPVGGQVKLLAIGLGGAGCLALANLKDRHPDQILFCAIDTDEQALRNCPVARKHLLGKSLTRGLSCGGDPETGALAAEADREALANLVAGADLIFLLAGMGGGTGGGVASILARIAEESGALVIAYTNLPFSCEGARRRQQAEECLGALRGSAHAVIPLPNDLLLQVVGEDEPLPKALRVADDWMAWGVISIWRMLHWRGLMNLDFASLEKIFGRRGGKTVYGFGTGEGVDASREALRQLDLCPLLQSPEFSRWADRLLINITGGPELRMHDVRMLIDELSSKFGPDAFLSVGVVQREEFKEMVEVCVIGTTDVHDGRKGGRGAVAAAPRKGRGVAVPAKSPASKLSPVDTQLEPPATAVPLGPNAAARLEAGDDEDSSQREFPFEDDRRGHFDNTDKNLYQGVDLDTPTYQRRGIKINL